MSNDPLASESSGSQAPDDLEAAPSAPPEPTGRTRLSGLWVGVIVGGVILIFLLIFVIQNTESVKVSFLTVGGRMPLGVALLLAAVGGVLLAGLVASLRIWQLRHRLRESNSSIEPPPS
jgi:lipopolysaccharide assembly protein A